MTDPPKSSPPSTPAAQGTHSIAGAAGLIGTATFTSRILGFIRDIVLAQLFGASASADAFYVAYRIPNLLRELFAEGSMSSAFIPVFTEYHTLRSKKETWELASAAFTTLVTITTGVTILGILAAPGLVWLLAPGFHEEAAKLATTTLLTQVMFPYLFFVSLAAFAMGILNSFRAFAWPALSPVFFNLCIIFFALGVSPLVPQTHYRRGGRSGGGRFGAISCAVASHSQTWNAFFLAVSTWDIPVFAKWACSSYPP